MRKSRLLGWALALGVGLGLAIVKTCAESCGGSVSAANRPGGGFAVTITVPRAGQSSDPGSSGMQPADVIM